MKYLCLVYIAEEKLEALSDQEFAALDTESADYDAELRRSGHLIAAEALQPVQSATTLRVRKSKLSTTDGPFAETKEQLGGFILLNAKDLNEAIRLASNAPPARFGSVEVRPVREKEKEHWARRK
jgi:hypothetical protein